jgi:hypothetical protein
MSTTAETTVEHDPREKPGAGGLNPVTHVVRIVVVPRAHGSRSASQRDGQDQSHGLPDGELTAATDKLTRMDPPPSPDGTSARLESSAAAFPKPKNMFEALKSTDIVAIGPEAASVRVVYENGEAVPLDESRQPVPRSTADTRSSAVRSDSPTRRLFRHDDRNRDTVLRVWTESDTIEYQCDQEFEIVKVERAGWKIYGAPDNLFERESRATPYKATKERTSTIDAAGNPKFVWKWTSGRLPARANNQQYKMTFKIGNKKIDPDVVCGDPPPSS